MVSAISVYGDLLKDSELEDVELRLGRLEENESLFRQRCR